jgi:hypothetical protein
MVFLELTYGRSCGQLLRGYDRFLPVLALLAALVATILWGAFHERSELQTWLRLKIAAAIITALVILGGWLSIISLAWMIPLVAVILALSLAAILNLRKVVRSRRNQASG